MASKCTEGRGRRFHSSVEGGPETRAEGQWSGVLAHFLGGRAQISEMVVGVLYTPLRLSTFSNPQNTQRGDLIDVAWGEIIQYVDIGEELETFDWLALSAFSTECTDATCGHSNSCLVCAGRHPYLSSATRRAVSSASRETQTSPHALCAFAGTKSTFAPDTTAPQTDGDTSQHGGEAPMNCLGQTTVIMSA